MKNTQIMGRELEILNYVTAFIATYGYSPSIREIVGATSIPSTSVVNYYLQKLERRGYITREPRIARSIVLLSPAKEREEWITTVGES